MILLFSIQMNGQNENGKKQFRVDLLTVEKSSKDTIIGSIIEIYSGEKRIETDISDFDGISILVINSKDIVDDKIRLKIYGPKCSIFEKGYHLTNDLNTKINLEYGETEYTHHNQLSEMYKKLNIKPKVFECGTID